MEARTYLAADFGGGSGRVMAGTLAEDGSLRLEEIYRFENHQVRLGEHIYWDFPALFRNMVEGMRRVVQRGYRIRSIAVDTWGVDFGFIDRFGNPVANPICYRDPSSYGMVEKFFANHPVDEHYGNAGIQILNINSLYRLLWMKESDYPPLQIADKLLFTPDLFSYFLSGEANVEYSIASTSELLDAAGRCWNYELIDELGLKRSLFPPLVMPGTVRGRVKPEILRQIGADYNIDVVAAGSHDTASAAFAVADHGKTTAFISCGTWSLLGVLLDEPVLTRQARLANCSNEGGVGKICFLQNITGLWILQRLMDKWAKEGRCTDYATLIAGAEASDLETIIDVDDDVFTSPADMETAINDYCRARGLRVPANEAEYMRLVCQSLAERYRKGIVALNALLPKPVERLQILGGGSRNTLLCRMTADATGLETSAGPVEATAIGNILCQAIADGAIASVDDVKLAD